MESRPKRRVEETSADGRRQLKPEHLGIVTDEMSAPVLGYLNLPPVGALNDAGGAPNAALEGAYELSSEVRSALLRRRGAEGQFQSIGDLTGITGFGIADLVGVISRLGDLERYGHRARPVWGGPESEREFFALLESAEKHIHIETYIIGGQAGLKMARLLARKLREGVAVRVLFCASGFVLSGSPSGTGFVSRLSDLRSYLLNDMYVRKAMIKEMQESGVSFVNSAPIGRHWRRRDFRARGIKSEAAYYGWADSLGIPASWVDEQRRIDRECAVGFANVDHRKMVIVDGERAFVGSQNLADSYFFSNELDPDPKVNVKNWQWHDNSLILEGGCVRRMNRLFARRWILSGGDRYDFEDADYSPPHRRVGDGVVTLETTIPGLVRVPMKKNVGGFLVTLLGGDRRPVDEGFNPVRDRLQKLPLCCQRDFYVEHCYPADGATLAIWAGMLADIPEFHMVVPLFYDTKVLGAECDRYFPEMMAAGGNLHGYHRAIMHSKILVMDGYYVATGSYNLNLRSSRADLENEFFIQDKEYGSGVRDRIRGDFQVCRSVEPSFFDRYRSRRSIPIFDALLRYFLL